MNFGDTNVVLRLQFPSTGLITNFGAKAEGTMAGCANFSERMRSVGLEPANKKCSYGWVNNPLKFNDLNLAKARITEAHNKFKNKPKRSS